MLNSQVKQVVALEDQAVTGKEIKWGFWRAAQVLFLDVGVGSTGVFSLRKFFTFTCTFL